MSARYVTVRPVRTADGLLPAGSELPADAPDLEALLALGAVRREEAASRPTDDGDMAEAGTQRRKGGRGKA